MIIKYNTEQLNQFINNIFTLTGVSFSVLDTDYNPIANCYNPNDFCTLLQGTDREKNLCAKCDRNILDACRNSKALKAHICRAGLYDSAMPIIKYDTIVGYVIMGRVRSLKSPEELEYRPDADISTLKLLEEKYKRLHIMKEKQLLALYELLPFILFDNAIQIIYDPFISEVLEFINNNLSRELSIELICKKFHISTNYLYKLFKENLQITVNEYIIEQRLKKAKELLLNENIPVYLIAEQVGIGNYTYFCRLFKKRNGITPDKFRKKDKLK